MLLQLYSMIIITLDFLYMVLQCAILWGKIIFRMIFPAEFEPMKGKIILITGSGQGIGRELAHQFSALGCIIIIWDINLEAAQRTANEIKQKGGMAYAFHGDVSNQKEVEAVAQKVLSTVSHLDIIINNAGIMPCHPFLDHSIQEIDRCIDINVKGCIW